MAAPLDQNSNVLASALPADSASGETSTLAGGGAPTGESFERIYEEWFEHVSRWVRALGVREADRADVVQEVFLVVHRRLADFDGENVAGWLYQIARRKVRDHRHLTWVKHLFSASSVPVVETMLAGRDGPLDGLETKQRLQLLERLLAHLNADQRAAFVLFEIEGNSGEEIARLQGVPLNTVWARIHKARKKLQAGAARALQGGRR